MTKNELLDAIDKKYDRLGEDDKTYLEGLLHAKPVTYWDYIQVDTLLSLQNPRTHFNDETIFIVYHQVTELVMKLIIHELKQLTGDNNPTEAEFIEKVNRLPRYTDMLITSFDVMGAGMSYEDYNQFRMSLAPASGFQTAQFRFLEIYCTPLINLINEDGRKRLPENPSIEDCFDQIYWKDAGHNRETDEKKLMLKMFEDKYLDDFISLAKDVEGQTLAEKFAQFPNPSDELIKAMRKFDYAYNVEWPLVHLGTAARYLDQEGETKAATGGSKWKKYLNPKFQRRKFFPSLWSEEELKKWGKKKR